MNVLTGASTIIGTFTARFVSGLEFDGASGLREILAGRDEFIGTVTERLLTYAGLVSRRTRWACRSG